MKFRRFTKTKFLTEIGRELLVQFFERFERHMADAKLASPRANLTDDEYVAAAAAWQTLSYSTK